jgi:hypothetical protein
LEETKRLNYKTRLKLIAQAKKNKTVLVFNFQGHEMKFADPEWKIINEEI